jgi:hypothetical protein
MVHDLPGDWRFEVKSPPTLTDQALNQLVKGCEIAMNSAIFLAHEKSQLHAANEKQSRNALDQIEGYQMKE